MTTPAELIAKARELDAATPSGPWFYGCHNLSNWNVGVAPQPDCLVELVANKDGPRHDAALRFTAEARTLLPALTTALEQSEKARAEAESELTQLREQIRREQKISDNLRHDIAVAHERAAEYRREVHPVVEAVEKWKRCEITHQDLMNTELPEAK